MNLLIVFAFAGDSTMTRFLAIAERPKLPPRRRNSSRAHQARAHDGIGMIERATITPRREKAKITTNGRKLGDGPTPRFDRAKMVAGPWATNAAGRARLLFFLVVRAAGGFVLFGLVVERLVGDAEDLGRL